MGNHTRAPRDPLDIDLYRHSTIHVFQHIITRWVTAQGHHRSPKPPAPRPSKPPPLTPRAISQPPRRSSPSARRDPLDIQLENVGPSSTIRSTSATHESRDPLDIDTILPKGTTDTQTKRKQSKNQKKTLSCICVAQVWIASMETTATLVPFGNGLQLTIEMS